jgi:predicted phosphodiesterase
MADSGRLRIGLLSDIHANLAGLRAVVAALERRAPLDDVVVAGDLVYGGPRPRETWTLLRTLGWSLIRGNEDEVMTAAQLPSADPAFRYTKSYAALHAWGRAQLGDEIVRELGVLPFSWRRSTPAGDLLVVHATPRGTDDRAGGIDDTAADLTAAYEGTGAGLIAFGHYHKSSVRPMPFALLVNVASVGLPVDGEPYAAYTVVTASADGWVVEQHHVHFDPAEEAAAAAANGLPPWVPDAS